MTECIERGHEVVKASVTRRFYKCGQCGRTARSAKQLMLAPCRFCGQTRWKRTSMASEVQH